MEYTEEHKEWPEEETTLSEKIYLQAPGSVRLPDSLAVDDVKEFIKRLKDEIILKEGDRDRIDKLAGEKLI